MGVGDGDGLDGPGVGVTLFPPPMGDGPDGPGVGVKVLQFSKSVEEANPFPPTATHTPFP